MNKDSENDIEKNFDFADQLIDMMIAAGDRNFMILKKSNNIIRILQNIEKDFVVRDKERDVEQIIEFLEDKEKEIKTFYNNLKGNNNEYH